MTHCKYFFYMKASQQSTETSEVFHFPERLSQFLESKLCSYPSPPSRAVLPLPHPGQFNMSHCLGFVLWNNIFSWESDHAKHSSQREWKFTHKTFFQQQDPGGNLIRMFKGLTSLFSVTPPKFLREKNKWTTYLRFTNLVTTDALRYGLIQTENWKWVDCSWYFFCSSLPLPSLLSLPPFDFGLLSPRSHSTDQCIKHF